MDQRPNKASPFDFGGYNLLFDLQCPRVEGVEPQDERTMRSNSIRVQLGRLARQCKETRIVYQGHSYC